jgi:CubicO group peptidase (beta-lactamase class C family)
MKKQLYALSVVTAALLAACGAGEPPRASLAAPAASTLSVVQTSATPKARCALPTSSQVFGSVNAAALGFNQARLDAALQYGARLGSTTMRVYRHGCLAARSALDPLTVFVPQVLFSGSKTILSLSVGRAVTLGYLKLDEPIGKYLPEADPAHAAITVRQLLNQTSGLQLVLADEAAALTTDPVKYTLALPFWYPPGTEFMYAQNTLTTLARVLERATGQDYQAFTQQELMGRVGIPRNHWIALRDRSANTFVWGGLMLRPDDEARLGHLMLHQGKWGDEQLISHAYMSQATTGTTANPGHGFLIWLNAGDHYKAGAIGRPVLVEQPLLPGSPHDAFGAMGAFGQMTVVVPSRDLVFVRNGVANNPSTAENHDFQELIRQVIAAVDDLPQITDPAPASYPAATSPFDVASLDDLTDWRLIGTLLGVGTGATPGCSLLFCNGHNLVFDAGKLGTDAVQQLLAAEAATAVDVLRGEQPSAVISE